MSRDHTKLDVFHDSHRVVLAIYRSTRDFPRDEWFGLRQQMRRCAVSVPANIVEGSARRTTADYCSFLTIALGSACKLGYLIGLASELGFLQPTIASEVSGAARSMIRKLQRLSDALEKRLAAERAQAPRAKRPTGVRSPESGAR
jgi:four helix bundle protein